ncbi:OsmC family protein [Membranicola marinus]|uniref:OsmC family protein n=1 Tax=Membranihabitans marinus TaxID=1227546 RepID=A0A953HUK8_9BACT|nr:OsmC family protein [Membranihabitans marinus]MBY5958730.1 OsmC family protein [Membranihabitans marinus]
MEVTIERKSGQFHLESFNEDGLSVQTDASESIGGTNQGVRPMQMVLMAMGSCSAIDVISILQKQKQVLDDIKINIRAQREEGKVPSLFTHIDIHFKLFGDIEDKKAKRAVELSMDKYCSVAQILKKTADIGYTFEIINEKKP